MAAGMDYPSSIGYFHILENGPLRIVVESSSHPMLGEGVVSYITVVVRYWIYPDGRIYIQNTATSTQDAVLTEWRHAIIGLFDPSGGGSDVDSHGWIRSTDLQSPYDYYPGSSYLYVYWDSINSGVYNNYTKASILLVPAPNNPVGCTPLRHGWGSAPTGFKRWCCTAAPTMTANVPIVQNYLLHLGSQGGALPNIINSTVAGPIAVTYLANTTPPDVSYPDSAANRVTGRIVGGRVN